MPYPATHELHRRRTKRVILGKLEFGSEDPALERGALGALDQGFPVKHVIFGHRASSDAVRGVLREVLVLVEEAFLGDGGHDLFYPVIEGVRGVWRPTNRWWVGIGGE